MQSKTLRKEIHRLQLRIKDDRQWKKEAKMYLKMNKVESPTPEEVDQIIKELKKPVYYVNFCYQMADFVKL
jgi:hypothetical protein